MKRLQKLPPTQRTETIDISTAIGKGLLTYLRANLPGQNWRFRPCVCFETSLTYWRVYATKQVFQIVHAYVEGRLDEIKDKNDSKRGR